MESSCYAYLRINIRCDQQITGFIYSRPRKHLFTNGNLDFVLYYYLYFNKTPKKAMLNILPFCLGMLSTYYAAQY